MEFLISFSLHTTKSKSIGRKNEDKRIISVSQAQSNTNSDGLGGKTIAECVINYDLSLNKGVCELNRIDYCVLLLLRKCVRNRKIQTLQYFIVV